jgi:hypothetical protein
MARAWNHVDICESAASTGNHRQLHYDRVALRGVAGDQTVNARLHKGLCRFRVALCTRSWPGGLLGSRLQFVAVARAESPSLSVAAMVGCAAPLRFEPCSCGRQLVGSVVHISPHPALAPCIFARLLASLAAAVVLLTDASEPEFPAVPAPKQLVCHGDSPARPWTAVRPTRRANQAGVEKTTLTRGPTDADPASNPNQAGRGTRRPKGRTRQAGTKRIGDSCFGRRTS